MPGAISPAVTAEVMRPKLREIGARKRVERAEKINGRFEGFKKVFDTVMDYANALTSKEGTRQVGVNIQEKGTQVVTEAREKKNSLIERMWAKKDELVAAGRTKAHEMADEFRTKRDDVAEKTRIFIQEKKARGIHLTNEHLVNPLDRRANEIRAGAIEVRAGARSFWRQPEEALGGFFQNIGERLTQRALNIGDKALQESAAAGKIRVDSTLRTIARA